MITATPKSKGKTLKFKNIRQAAGYFTHADPKASSFESALVNLRAVRRGSQTTGGTKSGIENRESAFGYIWHFGD